MSRLDVIDADGHILEPPDLWERYIDPKFRESCPKILVADDGTELLRIDDGAVVDSREMGKSEQMQQGFNLGSTGAMGARDGKASLQIKYEEGQAGGFDPHKRIPDMDAEGIDAVVLYPSLGLMISSARDPLQAAANCRAYNRWLADYCRPYPDRLFGAAMLPTQSIELAVRELHHAVNELGFRSGFVYPNCNERVLHDPIFYPLWQACQDLDVAIAVHAGGASPYRRNLGTERFPRSAGMAVEHLVSHTMEMTAAAVSFIMCGICDRFPRLRVAFLEAGGGWIAGWLDRMDRHFDDASFNDTGLKTRPSEIFHRQCFISFEPIEGTLPLLADYLGPTNILWATDYPHHDGFWNAPQLIKGMGMRADLERAILAEGAKRLYKLG